MQRSTEAVLVVEAYGFVCLCLESVCFSVSEHANYILERACALVQFKP